MSLIDWLVIVLPLILVLSVGVYTHRYMKSVAAFVSGGRLADRYLLSVSRGEMQAGAVVFIAAFEVIAQSGLTLTWWNWLHVPVGLVLAMTGFVVYRYRETRAMTLAQFFELRYSKNFRVFTGVLAFVAGIVNFGIIPAIGARFMIHYLNLPHAVVIGSLEVPSYILMMGLLLSITLFLTLIGGLVTLMVTDCLEGIISQILYLVILAALLAMFSWADISQVLTDRPPGQSLLNPFDSSGIKDFNVWYVLMGLFVTVYGTMAWQNQGSYNGAASNAHESRMGLLLGRWRESAKLTVVALLGICALTYLYHPAYAAQSAAVQAEVAQITSAQAQDQMRLPLALAHLLPVGIKGALCVVLLMGIFGGDSTHLHSWGSIFVQDVLVPLRKKPFGQKQHICALRWSMAGVAVFAFLFGALYQQMDQIVMWWAVTMAVYVGGAGAAIIGGLYWKRGTTAGAWAAMLVGSVLSGGGMLARHSLGSGFPLNGMQVSFFACLAAIASYVIVSLLTCREPFNLERMLHREGDKGVPENAAPRVGATGWRHFITARLLGWDMNFTRGDKWITGALLGWSLLWFGIFVIGTGWNFLSPWSNAVWSSFWYFSIVWLAIFMCSLTAVWFTWGGMRDIFKLFKKLKHADFSHLDDGTVMGHRNLDEVAATVCEHPDRLSPTKSTTSH